MESGFSWNRSEMMALARPACASCLGTGSHPGKEGRLSPCNCVLRAIFRACYGRFRHCTEKEKFMSQVSLERIPTGQHRYSWGRKDEEYIADFVLVSRRALSEVEYRYFRFHFLLGADWKLCCRRLHVDRGTFFHAIYRIEKKLGRTFRELEPYGLFPLDEYFGQTAKWTPSARRRSAAPVEEVLGVLLPRAC